MKWWYSSFCYLCHAITCWAGWVTSTTFLRPRLIQFRRSSDRRYAAETARWRNRTLLMTEKPYNSLVDENTHKFGSNEGTFGGALDHLRLIQYSFMPASRGLLDEGSSLCRPFLGSEIVLHFIQDVSELLSVQSFSEIILYYDSNFNFRKFCFSFWIPRYFESLTISPIFLDAQKKGKKKNIVDNENRVSFLDKNPFSEKVFERHRL